MSKVQKLMIEKKTHKSIYQTKQIFVGCFWFFLWKFDLIFGVNSLGFRTRFLPNESLFSGVY